MPPRCGPPSRPVSTIRPSRTVWVGPADVSWRRTAARSRGRWRRSKRSWAASATGRGASGRAWGGRMKTLLWPLTLPYRIAVGLRNHLYDAGWLRTRRLPTHVISIGNLTVGGTGKTPLVIWTANRVLAQGRRVAVVSRGYRRDSRESRVLVSDGRKLLAGPETAGDEPCVIAQRCPGAVVAVGADRAGVSAWVLGRFAVDVIVLDDAFQHRAIARDEDVLLIDATDDEGLRDLLPGGRLREPMASARRATAIVVTRAEDPGAAARVVRRLEQALGRPPDPV